MVREPRITDIIRIVNPEGEVIAPELLEKIAGELSGDDVLDIHKDEVLIRFLSKYSSDDARFKTPKRLTLMIAPSPGEEAMAAAKKIIRPRDKICTYGRYWDIELVRGVSPESIMNGFYENFDPASFQDFLSNHCDLPRISVGIQLSHAVGQALKQKIFNDGFFAVFVHFGDGATAQGYFHEALNVASIFKLPVIFICRNNQWAISTRRHETTATETYAEKASAYKIPFLRIDGNDMFAVYYGHKIAYEYVERGNGPFMIEALTYRLGMHTTAASALIEPPAGEMERALQEEPLRRERLFLTSPAAKKYFGIDWSRKNELYLFTEIAGKEVFQSARSKENKMWGVDWITEEDEARYLAMGHAPIGTAKQILEKTYQGSVECLARAENIIADWEKINTTPVFEPLPEHNTPPYPIPTKISEGTVLDAVGMAQYYLLSRDPHTICAGEDVGPGGGVMRAVSIHKKICADFLPDWELKWRDKVITQFLPLKTFFPDRVINTPLCENGIVGIFGTGASLGGLRPIIEIQFDGFMPIAFDQILEAAEERQRKNGLIILPLVIRLPYGEGQRIGRHQTTTWVYTANIPGLIIACPATAQDAFDMLVAAGRCNRPVIFGEHLESYRPEHYLEELAWYDHDKNQILSEYARPLRDTVIIREPSQPIECFGARIAKIGKPKEETGGKSLTLVSYGMMVYKCLKTAEILEGEDPAVSVEVIDIRLIKPLDRDTIANSVKKTGKIVTVQEEPLHFGTGAEILATLFEDPKIVLYHLDAPAKRVGAGQTHLLQSKYVKYMVPCVQKIADACRSIIYEQFKL